MDEKHMREKGRCEQDKSAIILAAATQVLTRYGYTGVTISRVAAEAGVSRGLLHYYFKNKEDMLAKVLRDNVGTAEKLFAEISRSSFSAEQFVSKLIAGFREMYENQHEFFTLFMEGIAVSRQSELVEREIYLMYQDFRLVLTEVLDEMSDRDLIDSAFPSGVLASLIIAIFDGFGLQLLMVPGLGDDDELWVGIEKGILKLMNGC